MSLDFVERLSQQRPILLEILRGYAALSPVRLLDFPSDMAFDIVHDFLMDDILLNPLFAMYPPSAQYQSVFWKWALNHLEGMVNSEDCEINTQMYEHYVSLMPSASSQTVGVQAPTPSYVTYLWKDQLAYRSATLLESRTTIESGTTGLKTWLASLVLAQYLTTNPGLVKSARVLELGSGVGLLGIIVATLQLYPEYSGGRLTLSDVNEEVLYRCTNNTRLTCNLSSTHPALTCIPLDWSDSTDDDRIPALQSSLQKISPDLIIGADVVYDPSIIPPLVQTIQLGLSRTSTAIALIALTVRSEDTITRFMRAAEVCLDVCELHPQLAETRDFWGAGHDDASHPQIVKIFRLKSKVY